MSRKNEYDFVVTLKHPDYRIYNVITVLLCVMAVTASVAGLLRSSLNSLTWMDILLDVFIAGSLVISFINRNKTDTIIAFKWPLYASAFLWLLYPLHVPFIGIFYIIAALLERQIKFSQEIGFSAEGITFNTFPFRNYLWQDVKNAVLKDNLLTLDFKNNRITQRETESDVAPETQQEFNAFCRQQIINNREQITST
jgi:hypothetical protein